MAVKKEGVFDFSAKKSLAVDIFNNGVFQNKDVSQGQEILPFCFDFRVQSDGPVGFDLLSKIGKMLYLDANNHGIRYNCVAGVSVISNMFAWALYDKIVYASAGKTHVSLLDLESGKINGKYTKNDEVLLITDIMADAQNCFKVIRLLEDKGLKITAVLAIIDQEEGGGVEELKSAGYVFYSVLTTYFFLMSCLEAEKISYETYEKIRDFRRRAQKD